MNQETCAPDIIAPPSTELVIEDLRHAPNPLHRFGFARPIEPKEDVITDRWGIVDTKRIDKKELVEIMSDGVEHIATVTQGRSMCRSRFDRILVLIRLAPRMCLLLGSVLEVLSGPEGRKIEGSEHLTTAITNLLQKAGEAYEQGEA